jgi:hypothetical protein
MSEIGQYWSAFSANLLIGELRRLGTEGAVSSAQFSERDKRVQNQKQRPSYVIGADGGALSLADLPNPNQKRWVARHKANLVAAVRGGLISLDDACKRYNLSTDEFLAWQRSLERFGMAGLRVTRIQQYRD